MARAHVETCEQADRIGTLEREMGVVNKAVLQPGGLISQVAVQNIQIRALCWLVGLTCSAVVVQVVTLWFKK